MNTLREKRAAYARRLVETEQFEKAISLYNRMVADDPADVDALQKLAGLHLRRGEFAKALSANERIAEHFFRIGDHRRAATVYEVIWMLLAQHAPELRAGYALITQRLGEIFQESENRDEALRSLDRLLRLHHDDHLARVAARLCLTRGDRASAASALAHLRKCFRNDAVDTATASLAVEAFDQLGQSQKGTVLLKESARIAWRIGENDVYAALVDAVAAREYHDTAVDMDMRREKLRGDITIIDRPDDSVTNVDAPIFDESLADYSVSQEISADDLDVISAELISGEDFSRVEVVSETGGTTQPFHRETIPDIPPPEPSDDGASPIPLKRRVDEPTPAELPPLAWDDEEITPTDTDTTIGSFDED